jgi:dipeptidyl aminopeptidase/acylaminoacyl peptidase
MLATKLSHKTSKRFSLAKFVVKFLKLLGLVFVTIFVTGYAVLSVQATYHYTINPARDLGGASPAQAGLSYENVSFPSAAEDKLTLRAWFIPNPNTKRALILVHGQNANRTAMLDMAKPLWDNGYSLLLLDLRGSGLSDGDFYGLGQYEQWDVVGAANFLSGKGFGADSIGVLGQSLGAASAIMAMSQTSKIKAVVSDSGFADIGSINPFLYPGGLIAAHIIRGLDLEQVKPVVSITKIGTRHVFIIQGDQDATVPVSHAYQLKQAGGANVTDFWILAGVRHTGSYDAQPDEYIQRVVAFFDRELAK